MSDIHADHARPAPQPTTLLPNPTTERAVDANGSITGGSLHPALRQAPQDQAAFNRAAAKIVERITSRKG